MLEHNVYESLPGKKGAGSLFERLSCGQKKNARFSSNIGFRIGCVKLADT